MLHQIDRNELERICTARPGEEEQLETASEQVRTTYAVTTDLYRLCHLLHLHLLFLPLFLLPSSSRTTRAVSSLTQAPPVGIVRAAFEAQCMTISQQVMTQPPAQSTSPYPTLLPRCS